MIDNTNCIDNAIDKLIIVNNIDADNVLENIDYILGLPYYLLGRSVPTYGPTRGRCARGSRRGYTRVDLYVISHLLFHLNPSCSCQTKSAPKGLRLLQLEYRGVRTRDT